MIFTWEITSLQLVQMKSISNFLYLVWYNFTVQIVRVVQVPGSKVLAMANEPANFGLLLGTTNSIISEVGGGRWATALQGSDGGSASDSFCHQQQ